MDYDISLFPAQDYDDKTMDAAVAAHFAALDAEKLLKPGMRAVLKPNLLMRRAPSAATTTHPALVAAVIRALRRLGITDIVIADSPGGPYVRASLESVYRGCGMKEAAEHGAKLNTDVSYREIQAPVGGLCKSFNIISPIADADVIINLPKLKTHAMVGLSGAVKNMFGAVPGLQKPELHFRFPNQDHFCKMLVELSRVVTPTLTIVDAVVSMEGDGPSSGKLRQTGMTFAARNIWALDLALCAYMGISPLTIGTVRHSVADGLCPGDPDELHCLGAARPPKIKSFVLPRSRMLTFSENLPGVLAAMLKIIKPVLLEPRPVIYKNKCVGCGKCAESCAPEAISFIEKKAVIDRQKCIRCFCCHEMCPVKAIGIRRSPLLRK